MMGTPQLRNIQRLRWLTEIHITTHNAKGTLNKSVNIILTHSLLISVFHFLSYRKNKLCDLVALVHFCTHLTDDEHVFSFDDALLHLGA